MKNFVKCAIPLTLALSLFAPITGFALFGGHPVYSSETGISEKQDKADSGNRTGGAYPSATRNSPHPAAKSSKAKEHVAAK